MNWRNKWVWEKLNTSAFGTKATALNLLTAWRKAQEIQEKAGTRGGAASGARRWEKPPEGWIKINIDATLFAGINCIGLGSVARDANKHFIIARSSRHKEMMQPREAETISLKEVLSWVKMKNVKKYIFESDSQLLVKAWRGTRGNSYFNTIVLNCIELFQHFDDVLIK